jgi:hypothetical protein
MKQGVMAWRAIPVSAYPGDFAQHAVFQPAVKDLTAPQAVHDAAV